MKQHAYYLIYKPYQVLSQFSASPGKATLSDLFKVPRDVYPVGRLDYDSEGLLLLTNDATVNHALLHPSFEHSREYLVQVDGNITATALEQLAQGVTIPVNGKPYHTKPCTAVLLQAAPLVPERNPPIRFRAAIPAPWISLVLQEGKNRQVRKMTAAVGFPTLRLIRFRIEHLELGTLQPGKMIQLSRNLVYQKLLHE